MRSRRSIALGPRGETPERAGRAIGVRPLGIGGLHESTQRVELALPYPGPFVRPGTDLAIHFRACGPDGHFDVARPVGLALALRGERQQVAETIHLQLADLAARLRVRLASDALQVVIANQERGLSVLFFINECIRSGRREHPNGDFYAFRCTECRGAYPSGIVPYGTYWSIASRMAASVGSPRTPATPAASARKAGCLRSSSHCGPLPRGTVAFSGMLHAPARK